MNTKQNHLHLLPWYVSGKIGLSERHDIDRHLQECEDCRAEVASLTSMMRSIRSQGQVDHVAAADLVSYQEEALSLSAGKRVSLENHLAECPECRGDLRALREAWRREYAPLARPETSPRRQAARRGWILAAASVAAVAVLAAWPHLFGPSVQSLSPGIASRVVFLAPRRGMEAGLTLDGTGPWAIRVVLPFDAQEGPYRVQIRPKNAAGSLLDITVPTDAEQGVSVLLPKLSGPGSYEMILTHNPPGGEEPFLYSFELLTQTGRQRAN